MREDIAGSPSHEKKNQGIASYPLEALLPNSLFSSPAVSIRTIDLLSGVALLLPHHLESFTDSLVVTQDDKPVGMIGGIEVLDGVLKNPTSDFFDKTEVGKIMSKELVIVEAQTPLSELLKRWNSTRRAFAIVSNPYHGYSAISARKLLEIGAACKTSMNVSEIPKKNIATFSKKHTIGQVIELMFSNRTRKLVLENTRLFINDRIIVETISRQLNCLHDTSNFLEMKADIFKLEEGKVVSDELKISEACKIMYNMQSPYLMTGDQVISPWDIAMVLSSSNLVDYDWQKKTL